MLEACWKLETLNRAFNKSVSTTITLAPWVQILLVTKVTAGHSAVDHARVLCCFLTWSQYMCHEGIEDNVWS